MGDHAMNEAEQQIADAIYGAIQQSSNLSERSQQSADFRIGPSDLGHCSELVRRMLAGIPEPPGDKLEAFIGTALGDHVEQAVKTYLWPDAICQAEVEVELQGDSGTYRITGHPDIIHENKVLDVKSVAGLETKRRTGPNQQQQFQRHCYGYGAYKAGLLNCDLDEVEVGNVWIDRIGKDKTLHVQMEPLSMDVIQQAAWWIDEVVEAYKRGEEARKEPHFAFCEGWCGHFLDCRAGESDAEGLITNPDVLAAVDMLNESKAMESEAKRMKNQAQIALQGVQGSTGKYAVRWVHVNGGAVSFTRDPYMRLDVRRVR